MALVGVELEMLFSESDALTTRPSPCAEACLVLFVIVEGVISDSVWCFAYGFALEGVVQLSFFFRINILLKVLERGGRIYSISQNPHTFAERVKGKEKFSLRRPNCLHFKTKANLKRHEVIDLLKEKKFEREKFGVAKMKNKKIDITCKNRKYLLKLH